MQCYGIPRFIHARMHARFGLLPLCRGSGTYIPAQTCANGEQAQRIRGMCWTVTWGQIQILKKTTFILKVTPRSTGKSGPARALLRRNYDDTAHNFIIVVGLRIS